MKIKVGKHSIEVSDKVNELPKELVDFAVRNRGTNFNWNQCCNDSNDAVPFIRLEDIRIMERKWSWANNTYAFSIEFVFSCPVRNLVDNKAFASLSEINAYCYAHGLVSYDGYFVNLVEGSHDDIYEFLVKSNLDGSFPASLNNYVKWSNA